MMPLAHLRNEKMRMMIMDPSHAPAMKPIAAADFEQFPHDSIKRALSEPNIFLSQFDLFRASV